MLPSISLKQPRQHHIPISWQIVWMTGTDSCVSPVDDEHRRNSFKLFIERAATSSSHPNGIKSLPPSPA